MNSHGDEYLVMDINRSHCRRSGIGTVCREHHSLIPTLASLSGRLLKNRFAIDPGHKPLRNDITEHTPHSASFVASARFSAAF